MDPRLPTASKKIEYFLNHESSGASRLCQLFAHMSDSDSEGDIPLRGRCITSAALSSACMRPIARHATVSHETSIDHVEPTFIARVEPTSTANVEPTSTADVEPTSTADVEPTRGAHGAQTSTTTAAQEAEAELPRLKVAPSFLGDLKQTHTSPMSAWGDVIDNCRDAKATRLDIHVSQVNGTRIVTITDNGNGMTETDMAKGIRGIGYTEKGLETGQHYGFGATTSLPRLSDHCLVLSTRDGQRTACFLSTSLQAQISANETVAPQFTWGADGELLPSTTDFLCNAARRKSLATLLAYSPFEEPDVWAFFNAMGLSGTCVALWGSIEQEHELMADDLVLKGSNYRWQHECSLRSMLEILYYSDDATKPSMQIFIRGEAVVPRNWSTFLKHASTTKKYRPHTIDPSTNGGERPLASITFGYQMPLREIIQVFQSNKQDATTKKEKLDLSDYSGVFYYHRGRLIQKLHPLPCLSRAAGYMQTTTTRLRVQGRGLLGVCTENFLTPAHNKSSYLLRETTDSTSQRRPELLFKKVGEHADEHLATAVPPLLDEVMGKAAPHGKSRKKAQIASDDDSEADMDDDGDVILVDADFDDEDNDEQSAAARNEAGCSSAAGPVSSVADPFGAFGCILPDQHSEPHMIPPPGRRQQRRTRHGGSATDLAASESARDARLATEERQALDEVEVRKRDKEAGRKEEARAAAAVVDDAWMVCIKDGRKGRVVRAGKAFGRQLFQLRDQDGSLGAKRYSALDLRVEAFDLTRAQRVAAPVASLVGSAASVWWRDYDEDAAGRFWSGFLCESQQTPGVPGTFLLRYDGEHLEAEYEDCGAEELFIFVQPDGSYIVHRADDGEEMRPEEVVLEESAVAAAVTLAYPSASQPPPHPAADSDMVPEAVGLDAQQVACNPTGMIEVSTAELDALNEEVLRRREHLLQVALQATQARLTALTGSAEAGEVGGGQGDDSGGVNGPTPESWRWYVLRALLAEWTAKEEVVGHVLGQCSGFSCQDPRKAVITILQREKKQCRPLWAVEETEVGPAVLLTLEGESLRGTGGFEDLDQEEEEEEEGEEQAEPMARCGAPTEGTLRADVFAALCSGLCAREEIVAFAWECGKASTRGDHDATLHRCDVVTVLGKEKRVKAPLWTQEGTTYELTAAGRRANGEPVLADDDGQSGDPVPADAGQSEVVVKMESSANQPAEAGASHEVEVVEVRKKVHASATEAVLPEWLSTQQPSTHEQAEQVALILNASSDTAIAMPQGYRGRVVVDWLSGPNQGRYCGHVIGWKTELNRQQALAHRYEIRYDDTQRCEHDLDSPEKRAWVLPGVSPCDEANVQWQKLSRLCVISRQRLTDPARGERCNHPALCNASELRAYVGREKKCPIAFCNARLDRTAAVVVDTELRAQLELLPDDAEHFCLHSSSPGASLRVSEAASGEAESARKRKRAS